VADALQIVKGMLDVLVLRALAWAPMHGVEIIEWLETRSGGRLAADDSAVYQAVYRMEARGLVAAEWGTTASNRRARYYAITSAGRAHLRTETKRWLRTAQVVVDVLGPQPASAR
jgi:PadR family transcriptional regulator, regulatory protein PadR